jgi:5-methylcytosine-specific restriction endonuclease McrA
MSLDLTHCWYCNKSISKLSMTIDHFYPKSKGGIRSNKNKVPCCSKCNELKMDLTPQEFVKVIEVLLHHEVIQHKEKTSYLRRVKGNVTKLIEANKN